MYKKSTFFACSDQDKPCVKQSKSKQTAKKFTFPLQQTIRSLILMKLKKNTFKLENDYKVILTQIVM